jgi:flagellar assembly protein FliH
MSRSAWSLKAASTSAEKETEAMTRPTQRPLAPSWMPRAAAVGAAPVGASLPSWMAPRPPTRLPSRASLRPSQNAQTRSHGSQLATPPNESRNADGAMSFPMPNLLDDTSSVEERAAQGENLALHEENALLREENDALRDESEALREENAALAAHATSLAQSLATTHARVLEASEPELVRLALAIAQRVVGRELSVDPTIVTGWAREALACLATRDEGAVSVSPDVRERVSDDDWMRALGGSHAVNVDASLPPGSCVVGVGASTADASLATRFAAMRDALDGDPS